jgi:hypothetical protein
MQETPSEFSISNLNVRKAERSGMILKRKRCTEENNMRVVNSCITSLDENANLITELKINTQNSSIIQFEIKLASQIQYNYLSSTYTVIQLGMQEWFIFSGNKRSTQVCLSSHYKAINSVKTCFSTDS